MIKYLFSPMLEDHKMKLGSNEHWISALENVFTLQENSCLSKKTEENCDLNLLWSHLSLRLQGKLHFTLEYLLYDIKKDRANHIMECHCVSLFKYVSFALRQFALH